MAKSSDVVKQGDYIVIQRQEYFKLHKLSADAIVNLGKDVLDISTVIGKPYWSSFRMELKKKGKRNYLLKECSIEDVNDDLITLSKSCDLPSGTDNRNIIDDGSGQALPMEQIVGLRDKGLSSKEIVGTLIENSKTFQSKTEYSQQKYLKKKEKKYCEFIIIRKPTIRLIAEIWFRQDANKIMGLRMDTLSQLPTAVNLHPEGTYIIYESSCQGLAAAMLLNGLSSEGRLILAHQGNFPQSGAVLALNLKDEQESCIIRVNIYNLLRKLKGTDTPVVAVKEENLEAIESKTAGDEVSEFTDLGTSSVQSNTTIDSTAPCTVKKEEGKGVEIGNQDIDSEVTNSGTSSVLSNATTIDSTALCTVKKEEGEGVEIGNQDIDSEVPNSGTSSVLSNAATIDSTALCTVKKEEGEDVESGNQDHNSEQENNSSGKRKHSESGNDDGSAKKKMRWEVEVDRAAAALSSKADGLVLVCREHPSSILNALLPYIAPSRNFVVFGQVREPLQELFLELCKRPDVINVRLTDTWLRSYQVESNRTHPLVNMTGSGGYLLTGVVVENPER